MEVNLELDGLRKQNDYMYKQVLEYRRYKEINKELNNTLLNYEETISILRKEVKKLKVKIMYLKL